MTPQLVSEVAWKTPHLGKYVRGPVLESSLTADARKQNVIELHCLQCCCGKILYVFEPFLCLHV